MINVCGPRDPRRSDAINTTSRSKNWSRGLSPFFLGPVETCAGLIAQNVENAWQYSKVYECHVGKDGNPSPEYFSWAKNGWKKSIATRYPMGKGVKPAYSYWNGEKLTYVEARKKIYIPLYKSAVVKTDEFAKLQLLAQEGDIWLWDFDGYDYRKLGMTLTEVVNCPDRKMGHAFVLAGLLDGIL